jgi:hypothetical protein
MISSKCEEVSWEPVAKKLWSSSLKKQTDFTFLRWSLSHDYNFEMNDNDIADQLRLVYRIMRFQQNNKWWWALFLWAYEVSMVNAYVSMKRYCELKGYRFRGPIMTGTRRSDTPTLTRSSIGQGGRSRPRMMTPMQVPSRRPLCLT